MLSLYLLYNTMSIEDALPKQPLSGWVRKWIGSGLPDVSRSSCPSLPEDFLLGVDGSEGLARRIRWATIDEVILLSWRRKTVPPIAPTQDEVVMQSRDFST